MESRLACYYLNGRFYPHTGEELIDCISFIIEVCKKEKLESAFLNFNGVSNIIYPWIDSKKLSNIWYSMPDKTWYNNQKSIMRETKIETILN